MTIEREDEVVEQVYKRNTKKDYETRRNNPRRWAEHLESNREYRKRNAEKILKYAVWTEMKNRCLDTKGSHYHRYGGRGITICERWMTFANFLADMGERPKGYQLDRINNDGNYEPGNCRWASCFVQARNTSQNRFLSYGGLTLVIRDWEIRIGATNGVISQRLQRGWPLPVALTTPVRRRKK